MQNYSFGRGNIKVLANILAEINARKIFLVTDKNSFDKIKAKEIILDILSEYEVYKYSDFDVNPNSEDLLKGIAICNEFQPDMVIGIGGGSVMDTAKMLALFDESQTDIFDAINLNTKFKSRKRKLILIPTTAGTGSEATHFAVLYVGKIKHSISTFETLPDHVILDSELTDTMSSKLTAVTALDCLSQAIESFWAVESTEESREYSKESISLVIENYNELLDTTDPDKRDKMLWASYLAGKAINISKTTAPHAISYGITKYYGIPHGHAVALTLGLFIEFNEPKEGKLLRANIPENEYHIIYEDLLKALKVKTAKEASNKIKGMMSRAGLSISFREIGLLSKSEVVKLARIVNKNRLNNNPLIISEKELEELLLTIF